MLPLIDARTLFVASAIVFAGLVVSVVLAWRELGKMRGPDRFATSYVLFFLGLVLFALRGHVPDLLSITAANVLFVLGAAFVLEGTRLYYGLLPTRRITLWAGVTATAAFAFLDVVHDDPPARTILSSAWLAGFLGAAAWTIWFRRPRTGSQVLEKISAISLGACSLLFWARAVAIGSGLVEGELLWGSPWMALPPVLCTLCAVVWTTALLANTSRRLMAVVRSQNDLLASLLAVTRAAESTSGLDATLRRVLEAARSLTGATGTSLLLLDETGRFRRGLFTEGEEALAVGPKDAAALLERGLGGWVVRRRRTALVPDVDLDPRWFRLPSQGSAIRSALAAPIENGHVLFGVITLVHSDPEHFGEDQQHLLESTTAQIALAIRTAQLDDARVRATSGQALVNALLAVSARGTDPGRMIEEAAEAIARGVPFPRAFVALAGEDGHFRLFGRTGGMEALRPRLDDGFLGRALESGLTRREESPPAGLDEAAGGGVAWHRLAVPLRLPGRTPGVVCFESPDPFDDSDVALTESLAEAVSLGLGKAELARAREEMTRMMVHDLRGPITGVKGALELLSEAPSIPDSDRRLLDAARRNVGRQLELVDGILEIARLEEGRLPVRPESVALHPLVEEAARALTPAAEARGLKLALDVPVELPAVLADPALVVRVIENLVGNAVKFSAPAAGPIRVSARLDGAAVEVRVQDAGPGVDEKIRERLFETFTVGDLPGRGSGLGLAFCRLAVEAQGGRIRLESPGPGAVFAFSLPLADAPVS